MPVAKLHRIWRSYSVTARLVFIVGLLLLALVTSQGLVAWKLWVDARVEAKHEAHTLGVVLGEQAAQSLKSADLVLQGIQRELQRNQVETREGYEQTFASTAFYGHMVERMKALPDLSAISAFRPDGLHVNFRRPETSTPLKIVGGEGLGSCEGPAPPEVFIVATRRDRVDDGLVFGLGRCVFASSGQSLGSLVAWIKVDSLTDFYRSIGLPLGTSVVLRRQDGVPLVQYPGTVRPALTGDAEHGKARLLWRQDLRGYPMTAEVGISAVSGLMLWRQQIVWISVTLGCSVAGLLALLSRLMQVIQRFERSQEALVERNGALSETHLRLERQTEALARTAEALRESEASLAKQSAVLETTLEHMDQGLMMVAADRTVPVCNRRAMDMLELPPALMLSRPAFSEVLEYQKRNGAFVAAPPEIKELVRGGGILDQAHTYERECPDGRILEVCSIPLDGGGVVRTYTDITERKQAEQRLLFIAYHDELTGLSNRRVLHDTLRRAIREAESSDSGLAVLYLDLDRFKLVNDTRGHAVGDALLAHVARRLRGCLRDGDTLARLGGDEFAILLRVDAPRAVAFAFAERLRAVVSEPYELEGEICHIGASVGVALHPQDGTTVDALLRSADSALYRAKESGRNVVCLHEDGAERDHIGRLVLERDLRRALEQEQFELVYQPIFNVETGMPAAFEALVRWRHPSRGLLLPDKFIPVAEETGVIHELGHWVMRTACKEAATWAMPVRLAINLSSAQFIRPDLEAQLCEVLASSGLAPERLDLEVTETLLISEADSVRDTMLSLQRRGLRLVMDDFGTGHSSLKTLQGFPFQQIKVDRAFVAGIDDEAGAGAIIRAILAMAATMKLEVVAEGVETAIQREALRRLGCRYMQGFLLQEPQTPERTRDYLWRCQTQRVGDALLAMA
jgi:diguanylate cyclase (GGDEF)-like protein